MTEKLFRGVYAALLSPRSESGDLDLVSLRSLARELKNRGISRFAVNGATGEFCLTNPHELQEQLAAVQGECGPDTEILCGVGGAGLAETKALIAVAEAAGVQGLLLPMPYFFPYSQADLEAFCRAAAGVSRLPILLYNLPQFTSGLQVETVCRLIEQVPNIAGIKDSSGSLEIVAALTEHLPDACRIMGNDSALTEALQRGLCDGVVSGVACVLPELIAAHFNEETGAENFQRTAAQLMEFIDQLNVFPTPWGLKWAAEARGFLHAPNFGLPVSRERAQQSAAFREWMRKWLPGVQESVLTTKGRS